MKNGIDILCENTGERRRVAMGTSLAELLPTLGVTCATRPLAAYVNNRIKELDYCIYTPVSIRYFDLSARAGERVYQCTVFFLLQKAVHDLWPGRQFYIRHSMGHHGFYCELEGVDEFSDDELARLKQRMQALAAADLPIVRRKLPTAEIRERFAALGYNDKIDLLDTRPRLYSTLYELDGVPGYFYGALAPSTGYAQRFDLARYYRGFYIALPLRSDPDRIDLQVQQEKLFEIFREYHSWVDIMGVPTVGRLNARILAGDGSELIKIAEAFHEKKIGQIADTIYQANVTRGTRMVLISGPSSSGKTTTAKRLGIQLRILGLRPVLISLDDYFVEREKTPLDENGEYDYEALEAIDLEQFNDHLRRLAAGESVDIPRYDFITGRRQWHNAPLTLDERSILIIEGIHGLNPRLTPGIPDDQKFKIYLSCFTSVAMDNVSRIATTDNRLLRRLTRDYTQRGNNALATLARWESVRRGEERHIFPYQENADVMFNTSLFYELPVLRNFAEPILREVPDTAPEYAEARRMLKFLDNFIPLNPAEIPPTSILREFIGGSSFRY